MSSHSRSRHRPWKGAGILMVSFATFFGLLIQGSVITPLMFLLFFVGLIVFLIGRFLE
jgi:hypothetical protein